jgi:hypothetical protein
MKVLNRPMFRYGGPIKEGIMSGIKEPRRGYNQAGMVYPANVNTMLPTGINAENAAKKFENIFDVNNMRPVPMMPKDDTLKPISIEQKIKPFEKAKDVSFAVTDYFEKDMNTTDKKIPKNTRYGVVMVDNPDYGKIKRVDKVADKKETDGVVTTQGKSPFAYTADEVIEKKGKLPGDDDPPPATRKEKVNTILEGLGYDRASKNALYDAMIKAGQRISRTGLGAENLVSDVIAETSQSYDKPEKLREAANLMQVQQDLKLDQIEASKTNKNEEDLAFWTEQLGSKKAAVRYLTKDSQSSTEAYLTAKKATGSGLDGVKAGVEWMIRAGEVKPEENKGEINKKSYDSVKEFVASDEFKTKGPGVYQLEGIVARIDANGSVDIIKSFGTISEKTNSWWGFGS